MTTERKPASEMNLTSVQWELVKALVDHDTAAWDDPELTAKDFDRYMMNPENDRRWFPRWSAEFEQAFKDWARVEFKRLMDEAL